VKATKKVPLIVQKTPAGSHVVINDPDIMPKSPTYALSSGWWWGEDSNLRRLRRQIYSLFPLAAREPHLLVIDNLGREPAKRATIIFPSSAGSNRTLEKLGLAFIVSATVIFSRHLKRAVGRNHIWSQRRDSNPRPTDYKSVALPAELRWPHNLTS
jgi:hypothetical protein